MRTVTWSATAAAVLIVGSLYASTPGDAAIAAPSSEPAIEYVDALPGFPEPVRDESLAESAESTYIADVIWSNPGVFASGAWIGGETLREVYVKSGMRAIAAGILNEAGVSPASYELIDVPLSADELETALLDASAALHDTGVVYSSIAPLPETGELSVAAPSGSSLVTATDPTLAKLRVSEPTAILLAKLEDLGRVDQEVPLLGG